MDSCIICEAESLHAQNVLHCCCHVKQKLKYFPQMSLPLCVVQMSPLLPLISPHLN